MPPSPTTAGTRIWKHLQDFLRLEAAGGLVLMAASVLAMVIANSAFGAHYEQWLETRTGFALGPLALKKPILLWINDGLMAVFFFLVGMELKREVMEGHLASLRKASLPAIAALGGMAAPALIYAACNRHDPGALRGWAVPTATDIAFALGILSLLGSRVPPALKAFLLSVAIFDDLGAIVVIALFYSGGLSGLSLGIAAALLVGLAALNRFGVRRFWPYLLLGLPLWVAVLKSGIHATLAGVLLALFIPLRKPEGRAACDGETLLRRLEHTLHPWVAFGILPVFAFANAGVSLKGLAFADMLHPVPLGILLGLFLGKQIGVMASCWVAARLGLASLPHGVRWRQLYGVALLCGIGFTMSLFISSLAFEPEGAAHAGLDRLGILGGTLCSALAGFAVLRTGSPPTGNAQAD